MRVRRALLNSQTFSQPVCCFQKSSYTSGPWERRHAWGEALKFYLNAPTDSKEEFCTLLPGFHCPF